MKTLYLLRHAHAPEHAEGGDHGRPLSPEGRAQARATGAWLRQQPVLPDYILCSTATRTMQTRDGVCGKLWPRGDAAETEYTRDLYHAAPDTVLGLVQSAPAACDALLVVTHNPGITALAHALSHGTLSDYITDFSTGTVAVFTAEVADWADFTQDTVRLQTAFSP